MTQDTWQFQGRQDHGRWGHGTAPHADRSNPSPPTGTHADAASRPVGRQGPASLHDAVDHSGPGNHRRVSRAFYGAPPPASQLLAVLKSILRPGVLAFAGPVALASAALAWMGKSPAQYDPRYARSRVEGHPDASAVLDFANRRAAISIADPDGGPPATIGLEMHDVISNGRLVGRLVDQHGTVIATHSADGLISLTNEGEQALLTAQKEQRGPGGSPSARSPEENGPEPRVGFAIETRGEEEANLVASMRAQGKTSLEIQLALDTLRDRRRQEEEAQTMEGVMRDRRMPPADVRIARDTLKEIHKSETDDANKGRNDGLPPALWTYPSRARRAVIASDDKLREALAAGRILLIHFAAHHLIPIKAVHTFPKLFEAAARAGWRPDEATNLIGLPRNGDAQTLMEDALGEKRGVHDSGHPDWNEKALKEIETLNDALQEGKLSDGEVRRRLERIQDELRTTVPKTRVTTLGYHEGLA